MLTKKLKWFISILLLVLLFASMLPENAFVNEPAPIRGLASTPAIYTITQNKYSHYATGVNFGPNESADWLRTGSDKTFEEYWGCGPYFTPMLGGSVSGTVTTDSINVIGLHENPSGSTAQYFRKHVTFDVPPMIENDRILVPLRAILEVLGASVDWDSNTQIISAHRGNMQISLKIGDAFMYKNGEKIVLDVPAKIVADRTLVPIRAISEGLGAQVEWDEAAESVLIWVD